MIVSGKIKKDSRVTIVADNVMDVLQQSSVKGKSLSCVNYDKYNVY